MLQHNTAAIAGPFSAIGTSRTLIHAENVMLKHNLRD